MKKTPRENTAKTAFGGSLAPSMRGFCINSISRKILPKAFLPEEELCLGSKRLNQPQLM
jgi:hypothetical protein